MPKFRKNPIVIEAYQFNPNADPYFEWDNKYPNVRPTSYSEVHKLLGTSGCSNEEPYYAWDKLGIVVTIHGQDTVVVPGDWIIPESDGIHYYPCKSGVFEKTYEPIND